MSVVRGERRGVRLRQSLCPASPALGFFLTSSAIRASASFSDASSAAALRKCALSQSGLSSTHFSASVSA